MMKSETCSTARFDIYMAGDIAHARQVCREYCFEIGLCVHCEAVDYIYTGGEESGFRVGLINYPRFPTSTDDLYNTAEALARRLMDRLCQHSFTIVGPNTTTWISRREDDPR